MSNAPWLDVMVSRLGIQEIPGKKHNDIIVGWFHDIGHKEVNDDETSWCAVATGAALQASGYPTTPRDVNMLARSYQTYGVRCEPKVGALAIWPRGKSWQGHINIVESVRFENGRTQVRCVGGNQGGLKGGDAVTRTAWMEASRAVDFRWPVKPTVKNLRKAGSTEIKAADTMEHAAVATVTTSAVAAVVKEAVVPSGPVPPLIPEGTTDAIGSTKQVMEALNALVGVVIQNPWICIAGLVALAFFWLARTWKNGRLNRHILGYPLSVEAEAAELPVGGVDA